MAPAAYEAAVRAAREQNAKLLELRSATRLVEHRRAIGEPCSAIDRLAALCDWFGAKSELRGRRTCAQPRCIGNHEPMSEQPA